MKRSQVLAVCMAVAAFFLPAAHALPPSVMEPYRAYMAAIEADDLTSAVTHAEAAYRAGVAERVDGDTLAALAENRAQILHDSARYEAAASAWDDLSALAPGHETLAQAASAYLLAGNNAAAAARAQALLATGRGLSQDLSYLGRYVIAVEAGGAGFAATTGGEAFQRGRAPDLVQDLMREGVRQLERRDQAAEFTYAALAAGAARGIGLHASVITHLEYWSDGVDLTSHEAERANARIAQSAFADLLVRQGVFPLPGRENPAATELSQSGITPGAPPQYPESAVMRRRNGLTVVRFDTSEAGLTENIEVVFAVPDTSLFHRESIRAVEDWTYEPLIEDGAAVRREAVETTFRFVTD